MTEAASPEPTAPSDATVQANKKGALIYAGLMVFVLPFALFFLFGPDDDDRVREHGIPALGVVEAIEDTGNRFNDNPQVEMRVRVEREGQPPRVVEIDGILSVVEVPQYQPGARLDVRVDPEDPAHVVIVGPRPPAP